MCNLSAHHTEMIHDRICEWTPKGRDRDILKKIGYSSHENEITKPNIIQYPLCARHCVGAVKGKEVSHA